MCTRILLMHVGGRAFCKLMDDKRWYFLPKSGHEPNQADATYWTDIIGKCPSVPSFHGLHMSHYSLVVFLYIKKHQYSTCILIFGQWPKSMSVSCPSFHFNFHTLQVFLNSIVNVICCPGYRGSRGGITVVAAADFGDGNNENYLEINVN